MAFQSRYEMIAEDAEWVIGNFGSKVGEKQEPGSLVKSQARRIAEFVRQLDEAGELLDENGLDLIGLVRR